MIFLPSLNDGRNVFVFGSNLAGRHGAGAAYQAAQYWGAVEGVGSGRTGMAYALPTKTRSLKPLALESIEFNCLLFCCYAEEHPELRFLVTDVGCGLAGFKDAQIKPFFKDAPVNCLLPEGWRKR
jgi:hypothetical protein